MDIDPDSVAQITVLRAGHKLQGNLRLFNALVSLSAQEDSLFEAPVSRNVRLELQCDGQSVEATGLNYWEALCALRKIVEPQGLRVVCYGASLDCFPSRQLLIMDHALHVYRLRPRQKGRAADIKGLFEEGPDVIPSTLEEQEEYFREWVDSMGYKA